MSKLFRWATEALGLDGMLALFEKDPMPIAARGLA
jgi:hypothetical protein